MITMWEVLFGFLGAIVGSGITALVTIKIEKERTKNDISNLMDSKNNKVYERVENLNRELQRELLKENLEFKEEWERKKIDADIVAKSRINWINQVRKSTSIYISELLKIKIIISDILEFSSLQEANELGLNPPLTDQDIYFNIQNKIYELRQCHLSLKEKSEVLLLYFSENEDHEEIEKQILLVPNSLQINLKLIDNNLPVNLKISAILEFDNGIFNNIEAIRKLIRNYLKKEWEVAKKGS